MVDIYKVLVKDYSLSNCTYININLMFKPETNFAIDKNKAQIIKHYQRISDREAYVTAEMVRNALLERLCR